MYRDLKTGIAFSRDLDESMRRGNPVELQLLRSQIELGDVTEELSTAIVEFIDNEEKAKRKYTADRWWTQMRAMLSVGRAFLIHLFYPVLSPVTDFALADINGMTLPTPYANSCFCDSVMVALFAGTEFYTRALSRKLRKESSWNPTIRPLLQPIPRCKEDATVLPLLTQLVNNMRTTGTSQGDVTEAVHTIRKIIHECATPEPSLKSEYGYQQQDAYEFYRVIATIMEVFEETTPHITTAVSYTYHLPGDSIFDKRVVKFAYIVDGDNLGVPELSTPVSLREIVEDNYPNSHVTTVSLPVPRGHPDFDMDYYENMCKDEGYPNRPVPPGSSVTIKTETTLIGTPEMLCFQLLRTRIIPGTKTQYKVNTPVVPGHIVLNTVIEEEVVYKPRAFVVHSGSDSKSGHYRTFVRDGNGWYIYDDTSGIQEVKRDELKRILSGTSYGVISCIWMERSRIDYELVKKTTWASPFFGSLLDKSGT